MRQKAPNGSEPHQFFGKSGHSNEPLTHMMSKSTFVRANSLLNDLSDLARSYAN